MKKTGTSFCLLEVTLWALAATAHAGVSATGGTIQTNYTVNGTNYMAHLFTAVGTNTLTVTSDGNVEVLVVGGGGGGGSTMGGGGGGGGVVFTSSYAVAAGDYTVVVGGGGLGGMAYNLSPQSGAKGGNSSFGVSMVAQGGGGGAGWSGYPSTTGGSGGGGNAVVAASTGTVGQGFAGDIGANTASQRSGGGGGAGEKGALGIANAGGKGGNGRVVFESYYGGGGGGGVEGVVLVVDGGGSGGLGGGGTGSRGSTNAISGSPNTGGGGGGAGYSGTATGRIGGAGGAGIVIVRYIGDLPVVAATGATNVTDSTADLFCNLTSTGNAPTTVWLFWDTEDRGTNKTWADGYELGVQPITNGLTRHVTALAANTTYYYTAYASNSLGTYWSSSLTFKTWGPLAVDNGAGASLVGLKTATLNGTLLQGTRAQASFFWGESAGTLTNEAVAGSVGEGAFSCLLTNLAKSTTYYYRSYATNTYGWATAATVSNFTTVADSPSVYVATNGPSVGDGSSWSMAFTNIQTALNTVPAGGSVYLAGHTFKVGTQLEWSVSGVAIRGGYAGNSVGGLPGERDPLAWPTVITRLPTRTNRLVRAVGVTNGLLDGVTLYNGYSLEGFGGGLFATNSSLTVTNCTIRENRLTHAAASGAGIASINGSLLVAESAIVENGTDSGGTHRGAGLFLDGGTNRLVNSVLANNYSSGGSSGDGIYLQGATAILTVFNSLITGNHRDGIRLQAGTLAVYNSSIVGHSRYGLVRIAGTLGATNSIFSQNDLDVYGAASLSYCVTGGVAGAGTNGNFGGDPAFDLALYLGNGSPALNTGTNTASFWGLDDRTTRTNGTVDADVVDKGYHFRPGAPVTAADRRASADPALADLYVSDAGNDGNTGLSGAPFRTITRALEAAAPGSRIHVAAGVYGLAAGEVFPLRMVKYGVQLLGAGAAGTVVTAAGAAVRVLESIGVLGAGGRIAGLTFTGGAMSYLPTFVNQYDFDNFAARRGGGLVIANGSLTIDGISVTNNTLTGQANEHLLGGGIYGLNGRVTLTNAVVADNRFLGTQPNTGDGYGGGLFLTRGRWDIVDTVISNNQASFGNNGGNYAGGVYLDGTTHSLRRSVIINNRLSGQGGAVRRGGGVYMVGGLIERCVIATNWMTVTTHASAQGGGVFMQGGLVRNTLLTQNQAQKDGGAIYASAGLVESTTAAGNRSSEALMVAGVFLSGATVAVSNSVLSGNYRDFDKLDASVSASGGTVAYSCTQPERAGTQNNGKDPEYANASGGDFRLQPGSPAMNTGFELGWMASAADLAGNPRVRGGTPDMGAYESEPLDEGALRVNFIADKRQGMDSATVVFTAYVAGADTAGLVYSWDFNNDSLYEQSGSGKAVVTNVFAPGVYTVRLRVVNSLDQSVELVKEAYIRISSTSIYVWSGGDGSDGTSWAKAFRTIQAGLDFSSISNTIYLAGETFNLTTGLVWSGRQNVQILGGYEATNLPTGPGAWDPERWPTVIKRLSGSIRVMDVATVVSGRMARVTIANGAPPSDTSKAFGGGMYVLASSLELEDCIFTNNQSSATFNGYAWGGGLYALNSTVTIRRSLFTRNAAKGLSSSNNCRALGGGLASENSLISVMDSRFMFNDSDSVGHHGSYGGAMYLSGGTGLVRNALIAYNRAGPNRALGLGGGVYLNAGTILENCTVVSNQTINPATTASGDGVYLAGGAMTNTIVYFNRNTMSNTVNDIWAASFAAIAYTCSPNLTNGVNGNATNDPLFVNRAAGNFKLLSGSPCRNTGLNLPWMENASDLAGKARIQSGLVDMGAYELPPPPGTLILIQ